MKKFNLAKVISLVFVCVMLLGALALSVFATEDETVEIVSHNMYYGDTYQIMYAIKAPDGITVKATDSEGNEINVVPFAETPTATVNGVENCKIYILEKGVAAQAIDEVITCTVTYNNKTVVDNYSILQYIYERSQSPLATTEEVEMLQALLAYAVKADIFLDKVTTSFDTYQYVSVEGATVNGANPTGMYAPNSTPFANLDAIDYDATGYELVITVNGETKSLDELKALVVADATINVVVSVNEKAHEHNYTEVVTAPTCTEAGYTTYTCDGCGDSYTEAGEPATGHIDNDADYGCDYENCEVILAPEADSLLTIEQALKLGAHYEHNTYTANKYYVTGTITEIKSTQYGNVYIEDDNGNSVYVYGVYDVTGDIRYDALNGKPAVGDTITLYGIIGTYSSAVQMKNGWLQHSNEVVVTDPTCTEGGYTTTTCTYCGATSTSDEKEALGHDYVDNKCSRCGALNHEHTYTTSVVTDPTCTEAGYTTYTCSCGDSYKGNETEALGHIDENGDYECDRNNCSSIVAPKADTFLTIEQAIKLGAKAGDQYTTGKYYITGVIKNVYNTTYGNMYITDGTNELCVYGTYSADGSARYDALANKPIAGDTVKVYGILGTFSGTAQMKNGWITEHTAGHTCVGGTEATCTTPQTCTLCGEVVNKATGHSYVDGACSVCGAAQPSEGDKEEVTVSTTIADYAAEKGWSNGVQYSTIEMDGNITVTSKGGGNTGKYYTSGTNWRIYQSESGTVTIDANGKTIVSVKITYSISNSGVLTLNGSNVASATVVNVNDSSITFSVGNTGTATNGQVRITAIEVIYA